MSENEEREYVWDKEIAVPVRLIQYFDQGVRECRILSLLP
jgi:hypothetical protein